MSFILKQNESNASELVCTPCFCLLFSTCHCSRICGGPMEIWRSQLVRDRSPITRRDLDSSDFSSRCLRPLSSATPSQWIVARLVCGNDARYRYGRKHAVKTGLSFSTQGPDLHGLYRAYRAKREHRGDLCSFMDTNCSPKG